MRYRTCLTLFCLLLIIASVHAVCNWNPDSISDFGIAVCTGTQDSSQEHWPRLPADTEIGTAKEGYLAYLQEGDKQVRIDDARVAKYHYCEGGSWINNVDMQVQYSWWWTSTSGEGEWQSASADTFLIYSPGSKTFEFVATVVPSSYFSFNGQGYTQGFDTGTCSSGGGAPATSSGGSSETVPVEDEGFPWVLVVGALGALGVAGVVGAKVLGGTKGPATTTPGVTMPYPAPSGEKTEKKEEKKEEEVSYILQLSADRLVVTPDQPATLTVTVWKRTGVRPPVPAPEASIAIGTPEGSGLSVSPASGGSPLNVQIAAAGEPAGSPVILEVTASAGMSSKKAMVTVEVTGEAGMEFF